MDRNFYAQNFLTFFWSVISKVIGILKGCQKLFYILKGWFHVLPQFRFIQAQWGSECQIPETQKHPKTNCYSPGFHHALKMISMALERSWWRELARFFHHFGKTLVNSEWNVMPLLGLLWEKFFVFPLFYRLTLEGGPNWDKRDTKSWF